MWQQVVGPVDGGLARPKEFESACDKSLDELVSLGLYFDIIEKSQQLIGEAQEPTDEDQLMDLLKVWLWRFRALLATRQGALVAQEASERFKTLDELSPTQTVWDLRLLLIPVWAKGINQQAVQLMYTMAIEARAAPSSPEWDERLRRLGLEVAAALIGMRDFTTAVHHLEGLYWGEEYTKSGWEKLVAHELCLVYIYLGDTMSAANWASKTGQDSDSGELAALQAFAQKDYETVLAKTKNMNVRALALLHQGYVLESVKVLEEALETSPSPALAVNLFMTYDLIERQSSEKKQQLREQLAENFKYLGFYQLL